VATITMIEMMLATIFQMDREAVASGDAFWYDTSLSFL
jgi:hypothetical protein